MFIAALFAITRTWKQPRCPLTDEWIKKLWQTYTVEYYPVIKRKLLYDSWNSNRGSVRTQRGEKCWEVGGRLKREGSHVHPWLNHIAVWQE